MNRMMTGWFAALVVLASAASVLAHHSLVAFDTSKAVRVKGTVFQVRQMNPHSFIYLDEKGADGQLRRWAAEGPALRQLRRLAGDELKAGDVIEVCGYLPKEPVVWQIASTEPDAPSPAGRLLNAEMLVMPNGQERSWGDYGVHKCFAPGYRDQHSK